MHMELREDLSLLAPLAVQPAARRAPAPRRAFWQLPGVALACCLAALLPRAATAQETKLHLEQVALDKLPVLKSYLTVVEGDGDPVHAKSGFRLLIDNVEQKQLVTSFMPFVEAKEPVTVMLVVELTPTMEPAMRQLRAGITRLAKVLAKIPESRLGIIGYDEEVHKLEVGGRPMEVARDLDNLKISENASETHMIDAVRLAIELLRETENRRRLIVVFSDGIDVAQGKDIYTDIGKRAREAGIGIDAVGFSPFEPGRMRTLGDMTRVASGSIRGCRTPGEISDRFGQVADEVNSAIVATFALTKSGDGQPHNLQVAYKNGTTDLISETMSVTLPAFTPADTASRPFWHYLLVGGGVLLLLVIILGLIGSRMSPPPPMPPGQWPQGPQGQWQGQQQGQIKPGVYQPGQPPQRR